MIEYIPIDVDSSLLPLWQEDFINTRRAIVESMGYKFLRAIIKPSGEPLPWKAAKQEKRAKYHVWIWIGTPKPLSDKERLRLQFLLGDDYGRCWINYLRITKRKNVLWNKIFGYILWRRPLKEPCKSCNLRMYLEELADQECISKPE